MKTKATIGFRPDKETAERHVKYAARLGVNDSELIRRAYDKGFQIAVLEIIAEKKKAARDVLNQFKDGADLSFNRTPTALAV